MPLYQYQAEADGCEFCRRGFEVLQGVSDEPLVTCPECGRPCRRVFAPFATIKSTKDMLSAKNLAQKGFTQYKRAGGGYYEKTAGDGPSLIKGD